MIGSNRLLLLSLLLLCLHGRDAVAEDSAVPVVLWHGMGEYAIWLHIYPIEFQLLIYTRPVPGKFHLRNAAMEHMWSFLFWLAKRKKKHAKTSLNDGRRELGYWNSFMSCTLVNITYNWLHPCRRQLLLHVQSRANKDDTGGAHSRRLREIH